MLKNKVNEKDLVKARAIAEAALEWVNSQEGHYAVKDAICQAREFTSKQSSSQGVTLEILNKPFTI